MPNKSKLFEHFAKTVVLLLLVGTFLVSCKATTSVDIALNSKQDGSGKINIRIDLDKEAEDTLRSAAYKPIELTQVFKTDELAKIGFDLEVNGGNINISRSFASEKELQSALDSIAGKDVVKATFKNKKSFLKIESQTDIDFGLKKMRDIFLEDDDVKQTLSEAGIEFSSYETLVNKAFDSTTLKVSINDGDTTIKSSKKLSDNKMQNWTVSIAGEKTRSEFIIGNIGALFCLLLLAYAGFRKWRTPRLISTSE